MVPPNPKHPPTPQSLGRGCGHCAARFGSTDPTRAVPSQLTARSASTHSQVSSCDPLCLQLPSCPNPGCRARSSPWPRQPLAAPHTHPALLSSQHTAASPKHPWHPDMAPSSAVLVGLVFFPGFTLLFCLVLFFCVQVSSFYGAVIFARKAVKVSSIYQ